MLFYFLKLIQKEKTNRNNKIEKQKIRIINKIEVELKLN